MKKRNVLLLLLLITGLAYCCKPKNLKEGDIVFQISRSKQSPYVIFGTMSPWSHCGIIIEKNNKLYVLEASNVVKLTPYDDWKKKGFLGITRSKRIYDRPVKIKYKQYLGIPYDTQFKLNNNRLYCSELVYEIYTRQFGHSFKLHPISDYNVNNKIAKKFMQRRNIKSNQLFIAPCDL